MRLTRLTSLAGIPLALSALLIILWQAACIPVQYPVKETYYENEQFTENRTESFTESVPVSRSVTGEQALRPDVIWNNTVVLFRGNENVWYYGYNLDGLPDHDSEKIRILFLSQLYYERAVISVFDMRSQGQILAHPQISPADKAPTGDVGQFWISVKTGNYVSSQWLNLANIKLNLAGILAGYSELGLNTTANQLLEFDSRQSRHIAIIISGPRNPQNVMFNTSLAWSDNQTEYANVTSQRTVPVQVEKPVAKERTVLQTRSVPLWTVLFGR